MFDEKDLLFTMTVNKKMSNSNNGQSRHWSSSHKDKKEFLRAVEGSWSEADGHMALTLDDLFSQVIGQSGLTELVDIKIERVLGKGERLWDADSVMRGSAKQLLDSIVDCGILVDDNSKAVRMALGAQDASDRTQGPAVRIYFYKTA